MSPLIKELLLKGLATGAAVHTAKKTSVGVAYYATAGVIGLLGLVYLSIAAYGLLMEYFTAPVAAGLLGSGIIAVAGLVALAGYSNMNKKKVKKPNLDGSFMDSIENTAKSLLAGFEGPVKDNPTLAMVLAAIAGFAAADQINEKMH